MSFLSLFAKKEPLVQTRLYDADSVDKWNLQIQQTIKQYDAQVQQLLQANQQLLEQIKALEHELALDKEENSPQAFTGVK